MGYGNAIVRPLAIVFIASVIDAFADAAAAPTAVVPQDVDMTTVDVQTESVA